MIDQRKRSRKTTTRLSSTISSNYVGEIDYEKATKQAVQGMLTTLDPHSTYFPFNEFKKLKEDQDSRFFGIGVTIVQHRDGVYVQSAAGKTLRRLASASVWRPDFGSRCKDARDWSSEQVSKKVRGALGQPVTIKVDRAGSEGPLDFTLVREAVPLPSIRDAYMMPGTAIHWFDRRTSNIQGMRKSARRSRNSESQGMRQLVLDLRGNPGGLLEQAIDVSSEFLPRGKVVVSVKGRGDYNEPIVYRSSGTEPEQYLSLCSSIAAPLQLQRLLQVRSRIMIADSSSAKPALVKVLCNEFTSCHSNLV